MNYDRLSNINLQQYDTKQYQFLREKKKLILPSLLIYVMPTQIYYKKGTKIYTPSIKNVQNIIYTYYPLLKYDLNYIRESIAVNYIWPCFNQQPDPFCVDSVYY